MSKPRIFVTNDDGIHSPGLKAAAAAVLPLGEVVVVAPSRQGTSMGRCLRGEKTAALQEIDFQVDGVTLPAFHLDSSPAMAVKHGLDVLCSERPPDLILAGINYGENLGVHITHSGTVGAALQGAAWQVPAIAASLQTEFQYHFNYGELDWSAATHFTGLFAQMFLHGKMPADVDVLKIDVPASATPETEWRLTRLARQPYYTSRIDLPRTDSKIGDATLRIEIDREILEPDSDVQAVAIDGVVSVTPLSLDLTSRASFAEVQQALSVT